MKLLCGIFLLVAVSADSVPLEASFSDDVKTTEPTTTITPPIGILGHLRKSLLDHSKSLEETVVGTWKDITDTSGNSNTMDEPKKDSSSSIEWLDFPLGSLYEWLEQKAAAVKESKLRLMWQNRNKRSSNIEGEENPSDTWEGWSESEAGFLESLFDDYVKGRHLSGKSIEEDTQDRDETSENQENGQAPETVDGYEVQEFSEDDLKDIEPLETQVEEEKVVVTPTYPSEEIYETKLPIPESTNVPSDHQVHEVNVNQDDHSIYEDHEDPTGYEDHVDYEGHEDHFGHEDHGNHEEHEGQEDRFNHEDEEIFNPYHEEVPILHTGAISGTPGVEFPDYQDIPLSSFNCTEYNSLPGFYADMETGCQVFHVCYEERKASFLCPVGTIFNQAVLSCDFWYKSNCSQTPQYYSLNHGFGSSTDKKQEETSPSSTTVSSEEDDVSQTEQHSLINDPVHIKSKNKHSKKRYPDLPPSEYLNMFMKFFPVRAKVSVIPSGKNTKVVAVASIGGRKYKSKHRNLGYGVKAKAEVHLDRDGKPITEIDLDHEAKTYEKVDPYREAKPFSEGDEEPDREAKPFSEGDEEPDREAKPFSEGDEEPDREAKPFSEGDEEPDREAKPFSEGDEEPDREAKPHSEEDVDQDQGVEPFDETPTQFHKDIHEHEVQEHIDEAFDIVRRILYEVRRLLDEQDDYPRRRPTHFPGRRPTRYPGRRPTRYPSRRPTGYPSRRPTWYPSRRPTYYPTHYPSRPTYYPTHYPSRPTYYPTHYPSRRPTYYPSRRPTTYPSRRPTNYPSRRPTYYPSRRPTNYPSRRPTNYPSRRPTNYPSRRPTNYPSRRPTNYPSRRPTYYPSRRPTWYPSRQPTRYPSRRPTWYPRRRPYPTGRPCRCDPWYRDQVSNYGKYPRRPGPCRCHRPLTPINPRFVVKPIQIE